MNTLTNILLGIFELAWAASRMLIVVSLGILALCLIPFELYKFILPLLALYLSIF